MIMSSTVQDSSQLYAYTYMRYSSAVDVSWSMRFKEALQLLLTGPGDDKCTLWLCCSSVCCGSVALARPPVHHLGFAGPFLVSPPFQLQSSRMLVQHQVLQSKFVAVVRLRTGVCTLTKGKSCCSCFTDRSAVTDSNCTTCHDSPKPRNLRIWTQWQYQLCHQPASGRTNMWLRARTQVRACARYE